MSEGSDIFISYAHIDDQALEENVPGWVANLHKALEIRVAQLFGERPIVWRDPKLEGNDVFADALVEKLRAVPLLVAVLSPRYARSEWCMREVREFRGALEAASRLTVGGKTRLFKVIKTPIPPEEQPPELRDTLGYEFYVIDPTTGRARELDQRFGPDAERLYWAKLDDLAFDLSEMLRALKQGDAPEAAPAAASSSTGEAVFIAETTSDLAPARDILRRDLKRRGYEVLPDRPLPTTSEELEAVTREQLGRCRLSIHPVGRHYGLIPEGEARSMVAIQNELAIERLEAGGFRHMAWILPGLETDDERQARFLDSLREDPRAREGSDLLETPLDELKVEIDHQLRLLEGTEGSEGEAAEDRPRRIYLICEQDDLDAVRPLEDSLFDSGYEVITPAFEGDETELREDHQESLRICDAALVYYGSGNDLWLRRKLRELLKSAGFGRATPLSAKAIYLAPPRTPGKERLRTREALVLRPANGSAAPDLGPFLELIP